MISEPLPIANARRLRGLAIVASLCWGVLGSPAAAAPGDYVWEAVGPVPRRQVGVVLKVRIRDLAGRPQAGATIIAARIDRSPDGLPGAYAPVTPLPTSEYGVYGFKTDLNTDGRYALTVVAKLPYELQPVTGSVIFTTQPAVVKPPAGPPRPKANPPSGVLVTP